MSQNRNRMERMVFLQQLRFLYEKGYIDKEIYDYVKDRFNLKVHDEDERVARFRTTSDQTVKSRPVPFHRPNMDQRTQTQDPNQVHQPSQVQDPDMEDRVHQDQQPPMDHTHTPSMEQQPTIHEQIPGRQDSPRRPIPVRPHSTLTNRPVPRPMQAKKQPTPEEIRERNITWSLNIGVIMLLIGGLYLATSNWETMSDWMKASSIVLVSLLFFGIAAIADRILKIRKTAFAFLILGSLFLPISIISIGWFELLGEYLSIHGEGKYWFGFLGSFILLPLYSYFAIKFNRRLFVWISLVTLSVAAGFFIRAISPTIDIFYLGIAIYNAVLVALYHYGNKNKTLPLFTKELANFMQVNLVLSTLLMLFFFNNEILNGLNLILTAMIYLAMIYVNGRKEYHFVFTLMLVYGAYQVLSSSVFEIVSPIGYAMLGFVFLLIPRLFENRYVSNQIYQWTSAIISGFAFLFITLEGILLRSGEPSIILTIAYLMIAINFLFLANAQKNVLFPYLTTIFLAASFIELADIIHNFTSFEWHWLGFFVGLILFGVFGNILKHQWLTVIQLSSRDIGWLIMLGSIALTVPSSMWWEAGVMLAITVILAYFLPQVEIRKFYQVVSPWYIPIFSGFSIIHFLKEIQVALATSHDFLKTPSQFIIVGLLLLGFWFLTRKTSLFFLNSTLYVVQGFVAIGLLQSILTVHTLLGWHFSLWFIGTFVFYHFYRVKQWAVLPYFIAVTWYITYVYSLAFVESWISLSTITIVVIVGSVVLFLPAWYFSYRDRKMASGFAWVGHVHLAPSILLFFFFRFDYALLALLIGLVIYAFSFKLVQTRWKQVTFLYAAFTTLFLTINLSISEFASSYDYALYAFLVTSILLTALWFGVKDDVKRFTGYYLLPFSLLGLWCFVTKYNLGLDDYLVTLIYAGLVLFLIYKKAIPFLVDGIPLLFVYIGTLRFIYQNDLTELPTLLILLSFGVVFALVGWKMYPKVWQNDETDKWVKIDWYSVLSLIYLLTSYNFGFILAETIPGLIIAGFVWFQKDRLPRDWKPFVIFASGVYLLQPYYALIDYFNVPDLLIRELVVLPWVVIVLFLQFVMKEKYQRAIYYIQWTVLVIVALALIQGALASGHIIDAIILGSLALLSMICGMWFKTKSLFFVGTGVLILNLFYQTRSFWGNIPWWGYLVIGGLLLILIASLYEWNKQKTNKGEKTIIAAWIEKILSTMKQWK